MPTSMLEPEFDEPYQAWKKTPGPETNSAMLQALHPTIAGAIQTHVGQSNPLLVSRARGMVLQGLRTYDPSRGRLQTHLYNHLQGLKRVNRQQTQIMHVPERVAFDSYHLHQASKELEAELGREPTDDELADHTGFSTKRMAKSRLYRPGVAEGTMESAGGGEIFGSLNAPNSDSSAWQRLVYDDLDPYHKKVMEHALGLHGRPVLPNHVIAQKLNRSPGAISQAKLRIQQLLDQEAELSPFGVPQ